MPVVNVSFEDLLYRMVCFDEIARLRCVEWGELIWRPETYYWTHTEEVL